jgi:hypothetical protein
MFKLKVGIGGDAILFTTLALIAFFCVAFAPNNEVYTNKEEYVGLQIKDDTFDEYYINSLIHSYRFSADYNLHTFDCSQMSLLVHDFLEEHNFSSKIAIKKTENNTYHSFVVVGKGNNTYIVETTSDALDRIGTITKDLDGYVQLYEPEELKAIDGYEEEWTTNETIVPKFVWKTDCMEYEGVCV